MSTSRAAVRPVRSAPGPRAGSSARCGRSGSSPKTRRNASAGSVPGSEPTPVALAGGQGKGSSVISGTLPSLRLCSPARLRAAPPASPFPLLLQLLRSSVQWVPCPFSADLLALKTVSAPHQPHDDATQTSGWLSLGFAPGQSRWDGPCTMLPRWCSGRLTLPLTRPFGCPDSSDPRTEVGVLAADGGHVTDIEAVEATGG